MSVINYTAQRGLTLLGDEQALWLSDTTTGLVSGSELVSNGDFTANANGWIATNATTSIASGELELTSTSSGGFVSQEIICVVGEVYTASINCRTGTSDEAIFDVFQSPDDVGSVSTVEIVDQTLSVTFTASETTPVILLQTGSVGTVYFDNVTVRRSLSDVSQNNNGLSVYGSLNKSIVNDGANLVSYSGFSLLNYLQQQYNPAFDFGTGDVRIRFWLKMLQNSVSETVFERDSNPSAQKVTVEVNVSGRISFACNDGVTLRTVVSIALVNDDVIRYFECIYSAGVLYLYINGALDNIDSGAPLLTMSNPSAITRIGLGLNGSPLINGAVTLVGVSVTAPTPVQLRSVYDSEKHLFNKHSFFTQSGINYILDLPVKSMVNNFRTFKTVNYSLDRKSIETHINGDDDEFELKTGLIHRTDQDYVRVSEVKEFIYSTRGSEQFSLDPYGSINSSDEVRNFVRIGNSSSESNQGVFWRSYNFRLKEV